MGLINADWWLYAIIAIGFIILMLVNVYILVLWQHPDDKNESFWPKTLVVLGLALAEGTVLFLPLDVTNNGGNVECNQPWSSAFCGNIDMNAAWSAMFYLIFIFAFFLIPYTIFFYEENDTAVLEGKFNFCKTFVTASKYMIAISIMVALVVGLSFYFLGISDVPVEKYEMTVTALLSADHTNTLPDLTGLSTPLTFSQATTMSADVKHSTDAVRLNVAFGLYLLAIMAFLGWFLFAVFAGLGIPGISIDYIRAYTSRPQRLDRAQITSLELAIKRRCKELVEIGIMLKTTKRDIKSSHMNYIAKKVKLRAEASELKQFKQMVYILEEDYKQLSLCKEYSTKYNPLLPIFWLVVGILSGIVGLLWVVHIIVYMLLDPPVTNFLNSYFTWFDLWFPLFGAISVALFSMYLLVATVKGCFKFGLRLMWFTLHPMKLNETYMNSFLFNVGIVLICVPAVIQFCVQAFSAYAVSADINGFINVQVRYLRFFSYFYANNIFIYAILIITLLATLYLSVKPTDNSANTRKVKEALIKLTSEEAAR